jgi:subtilisin family serine protease
MVAEPPDLRPAWSSAFAPDAITELEPVPPLDEITPEWAWGGSTGASVKVAVIDSGIDADHPAVGERIGGYVAITDGPLGLLHDTEPHEDSYGHGTACAGIIRSLASECELYSVKVLGSRLTGRGTTFAAGIEWAVENGMDVANVSMGTTKKNFFGALHSLADRAYFKNTMLVTAANNMPVPSFPSLYASVISVASHETTHDPYLFYYNPSPPVEFGAPGIDVRVAWAEGGWITATGNSFAAPHVTGIVAKILGKHPDLTLFQMKTVLRSLAANMRREKERPTGS